MKPKFYKHLSLKVNLTYTASQQWTSICCGVKYFLCLYQSMRRLNIYTKLELPNFNALKFDRLCRTHFTF